MKNKNPQLVQQLKAMGDQTRLRLVALCENGECSVSELTRVLGQSQPRISQQLKILVDAEVLTRFRDGKRVFYRVPRNPSDQLRKLLALIPDDDSLFQADEKLLLKGRGERLDGKSIGAADAATRALHRALLDLTVSAQVGDLLDVGCGRGAILKLLASRANRAIGVDIDATARQLARAELMLAGIPNCSLRKGDMYRLPFGDGEFNTIIVDDVLLNARRPVDALVEATRLLKTGGRLFIVESIAGQKLSEVKQSIANWCLDAGLRLSPARRIPTKHAQWLVAVATSAATDSKAA